MTLLKQKYDAGWLIIMAKVPGAGRVKTRLAREAGSTAATFFYRQTCRAVIARLSASHRWNVVLSIAPDSGVNDRFWPSGISKLGQGDGDIGRRMQRAIAAMPPGPVVLVGTDIPGIRPSHIARAFRALREADAVFGPAQDGGFWLVGMARRKVLPATFKGVRWSSPYALSDTLRNLKGYTVAQIDQLNDVDTLNDLRATQSLHGRRVLPPEDLNSNTLRKLNH